MATPPEILEFVYYRMKNVHNESVNVDYMIAFLKELDKVKSLVEENKKYGAALELIAKGNTVDVLVNLAIEALKEP